MQYIYTVYVWVMAQKPEIVPFPAVKEISPAQPSIMVAA
uniref:Uncharacterized protein n=1 Tax=Rhizophora mucronata TaxID=61149 RepID=A0A2P2R4B7_RHIMU